MQSRRGSKAAEVKSEKSTAGPADMDPDDDSERAGKRPKRAFLTQNACMRCRQKKSKCDGRRPTCSRCEKHTTECTYDVPTEGMTKMQNLQNLLDTKTEQHGRLSQLFEAMAASSDTQGAAILARVRMGYSVDAILRALAADEDQLQALQQAAGPNWTPFAGHVQHHWTSWDSRCEASTTSPTTITEDTPMNTPISATSTRSSQLPEMMSMPAPTPQYQQWPVGTQPSNPVYWPNQQMQQPGYIKPEDHVKPEEELVLDDRAWQNWPPERPSERRG